MILKFKYQPFQSAAVAAVVDLFKGQSRRTDTFTIINETQTAIGEGFDVRNAMAGYAPGRIIFAEQYFEDSTAKINVKLTLKDKGIAIKTL